MNRKSKPSLVSSTPHPTSKISLVSSTPHPTKRHRLTFEFEKDNISPITTKADEIKKVTKQPRAVNKRTKSTAEVDTVVLKKKKCTAKQEKESASSATLKELGVKIGLKSTNILSTSRNLYNMFPQPVILESDDETDLVPNQATTTKLVLKKKDIVKPSASSVGVKDVNKKRGLTKQSDECITKDKHKIRTEKEPIRNMTVTKETPQLSSTKSGAVKKKPLSKPSSAGSTSGKVPKAKDKKTETVQLITDSDDEDSMFPVNLSSARKNTHLKFSSLKKVIDENSAIKWTPRSKTRNLKLIKEEDSESESVNSDTDDCIVLKTINVRNALNNRANKENCKDANKNNVLTKSERIQHENPLPKELFSRFSDIVFRPSKQNKGVILASSLVAGSSEYGYIELDEAKLFSGKLKNVTFVMLEGNVKAVFQGKSANLSPGDILHIDQDSGYQLHKLGTGHVRLLYIKEKHS